MSGPIKGLEKLQAQHGILEPLSGEALAKATEDTFPYTHNSAMGRIAGVLFVTSSTIPGPLRTAMTFSKDVIELHTGGYGEVKAESTDGVRLSLCLAICISLSRDQSSGCRTPTKAITATASHFFARKTADSYSFSALITRRIQHVTRRSTIYRMGRERTKKRSSSP